MDKATTMTVEVPAEAAGYACSKCGGTNVQMAVWVRPNTDEVLEPLFDHVVPHATSRWCDDCGSEEELVRKNGAAVRKLALRQLTADDVLVELEAEEEDVSVRGHFASDDPAADRDMEDEILRRLDKGDVWAWFCAKVTVWWKGRSVSDYLGCCSYESEEDFRKDGCFGDMVAEALAQLNRQVAGEAAELLGLTGAPSP